MTYRKRSQRRYNIGRLPKKGITVRAYYCTVCRRIFHTAKALPKNTTCNKCGGKLIIFDKFKRKKPPRKSGRKKKWILMGD